MLTHVHKVVDLVVGTFEQGRWSEGSDCHWKTMTGCCSRCDQTWGPYVRSLRQRRGNSVVVTRRCIVKVTRHIGLRPVSGWCMLMRASEWSIGDRSHRCIWSCVTWRVQSCFIGSRCLLELSWCCTVVARSASVRCICVLKAERYRHIRSLVMACPVRL
jgi:hypothetical protein